jgi:RNA polymerase sigma-70 factor (ECF subfamily)
VPAVQRGLEHALDEYLVLLAQAGNREAFGRLAARWTPRLLVFAARSTGNVETAKDAVQETWESAVRAVGRLEDPARFPAWIYSIAARKCTDALRAKYRRQRVAAAVGQRATLNEPSAVDADAGLDLASALKRLPSEQRVAVALLYGEDMSIAQIAVVTGVPPGTVKSRLSAARHALRAYMEGENDE